MHIYLEVCMLWTWECYFIPGAVQQHAPHLLESLAHLLLAPAENSHMLGALLSCKAGYDIYSIWPDNGHVLTSWSAVACSNMSADAASGICALHLQLQSLVNCP